MPRKLKERGRPVENKLPPRVDATAEELPGAMFRLPPDHKWQYENGEGTVYRCLECNKAVHCPYALYRDGRCRGCKTGLAT